MTEGLIRTAVLIGILTTIVGIIFTYIVSAHKDQIERKHWNRHHIMEIGLFLSSFTAVIFHHYLVYGQGRLASVLML